MSLYTCFTCTYIHIYIQLHTYKHAKPRDISDLTSVVFLVRSRDCPDKIKFAKEIMLSANQCTHVSWGHDLLNCMLDFVSRLKYVSIDNTEFCILNAIVLTYPGM